MYVLIKDTLFHLRTHPSLTFKYFASYKSLYPVDIGEKPK
ncbi:hypothetical protein C4J87_1029 [Pseudomonas sp. R1-43-08]|nr:hypothetical protein C4J87_1029 [Pseudomonas sp. R1-43-08]